MTVSPEVGGIVTKAVGNYDVSSHKVTAVKTTSKVSAVIVEDRAVVSEHLVVFIRSLAVIAVMIPAKLHC